MGFITQAFIKGLKPCPYQMQSDGSPVCGILTLKPLRGMNQFKQQAEIAMSIIDFEQKKIDKEQPTIAEIINKFTAHNCDTGRPYLEQQPKRAQMLIEGLTRRDICDCMVLGILTCKPDELGELPRIHVSTAGNKYNDWESFEASGEDYDRSYIDPERVSYNDLYGWDLDTVDPVATVQNMACFLEERMGIFPALLDGKLQIIEE